MAGSDGSDDDLLLALTGIELAGAAVHDAVAALGLLDAGGVAAVTSFAEHHRAHAAAYSEALGGEGVATEPDTQALEAFFAPVFGAVDGTGLLQAALAVEELLAATAVDACARAGDRDLATLAARVAAVEARHQSILTTALGTTAPPTTSTVGSLLDG